LTKTYKPRFFKDFSALATVECQNLACSETEDKTNNANIHQRC